MRAGPCLYVQHHFLLLSVLNFVFCSTCGVPTPQEALLIPGCLLYVFVVSSSTPPGTFQAVFGPSHWISTSPEKSTTEISPPACSLLFPSQNAWMHIDMCTHTMYLICRLLTRSVGSPLLSLTTYRGAIIPHSQVRKFTCPITFSMELDSNLKLSAPHSHTPSSTPPLSPKTLSYLSTHPVSLDLFILAPSTALSTEKVLNTFYYTNAF
jgi:hypothetical protein